MIKNFLRTDFRSAIVVFLVALPLCLGIALASGAPLLSGIIAGVVGGLVVGYISGSHTSVSGPAAGLTSISLLSCAAWPLQASFRFYWEYSVQVSLPTSFPFRLSRACWRLSD